MIKYFLFLHILILTGNVLKTSLACCWKVFLSPKSITGPDLSDQRFLLRSINLIGRYSSQFLSCNPWYASFDTLNSVFLATGNQFTLITSKVLAYFASIYPAAQFYKHCNLFWGYFDIWVSTTIVQFVPDRINDSAKLSRKYHGVNCLKVLSILRML